MAPLRIGVVIGRFQVPQLHEGHQQLLKAVRDRSDYLVVLLGVSGLDGYVRENPLTFHQRATMFTELFPDTVVLPLMDEPTNEAWSESLDAILATVYPLETVTLYGGRDSFAAAYTGKCKVETVDMQPAVTTQGTLHREAIQESRNLEFKRGQIYALQRQYPHAYATVDVALVKRPHVFLIRRADTGQWAFPGGFVDPKDESLEKAAARELYEETGLAADCGCKLEYVTSLRVNDWRYRGRRDKIMTTLFVGWYNVGMPVLNPSEAQDYRWATLEEATEIIHDTHQPLLYALHERLRP